MSFQLVQLFPLRHIPKPYAAVAISGGDFRPIWRYRHGAKTEWACAPFEIPQHAARRNLPGKNVENGVGGKRFSIRREGKRIDAVGVFLHAAHLAAGDRIPELDVSIIVARGNEFSIRRKDDRVHLPSVGIEAAQFLPALCVPDADRAVIAPRREPFAILRKTR